MPPAAVGLGKTGTAGFARCPVLGFAETVVGIWVGKTKPADEGSARRMRRGSGADQTRGGYRRRPRREAKARRTGDEKIGRDEEEIWRAFELSRRGRVRHGDRAPLSHDPSRVDGQARDQDRTRLFASPSSWLPLTATCRARGPVAAPAHHLSDEGEHRRRRRTSSESRSRNACRKNVGRRSSRSRTGVFVMWASIVGDRTPRMWSICVPAACARAAARSASQPPKRVLAPDARDRKARSVDRLWLELAYKEEILSRYLSKSISRQVSTACARRPPM